MLSNAGDATTLEDLLLLGVPPLAVREALRRAGGNELESGKLASPESSAALAVNAFGWFISCPELLPALPGLADIDWPAVAVDVERQMRFPWRGGRHPWLDATIETPRVLVGVESKRFEPFRDTKTATLSAAYDREVRGNGMEPWTRLRDDLRSGSLKFVHLDAVQLVKHSFGLVTEGRRLGKEPVLFYVFAEPSSRSGRPIKPEAIVLHRSEIRQLSELVAGARVRFAASSYRDWMADWKGKARDHAELISKRFDP